MSIALAPALAAAVLSGAAALVYEVVWLRMLGLVVGHAVDALTAVLAAFMAGLALGAMLFGRFAGRLRQPLMTCVWVEVGVAGSAAMLPFGLARLLPASLALRQGLGLGPIRGPRRSPRGRRIVGGGVVSSNSPSRSGL